MWRRGGEEEGRGERGEERVERKGKSQRRGEGRGVKDSVPTERDPGNKATTSSIIAVQCVITSTSSLITSPACSVCTV